jgi:hypothetical protein
MTKNRNKGLVRTAAASHQRMDQTGKFCRQRVRLYDIPLVRCPAGEWGLRFYRLALKLRRFAMVNY